MFMVRISQAIVHEIPKGRYSAESEEQVAFSSAASNLAPQTKRFIEENMLDFALKSPRDILEDAGSASSTPASVKDILGDPDTNFVSGSQVIARNLHQAQTGNSPSGILIVAIVDANSAPSLVIMKAEHQEGMRLQRVSDSQGDHFDLEHLNELIVGNNSRVYKIAVLNIAEAGSLIGRMVDQQNGAAFADFFMSSFLGCRLADNAEIQTKQFMESAMTYINSHVADEETRARYATALVAYMSSPAESFQASEFSEQFLEIEDRDAFVHSLPEQVASSVIGKNLSLVPGRGAGLRLYGAGVTVSASASALERGALQIVSDQAGETVIRITGPLSKYGLGSAPKG
jgi:nucleoid-associated protein YejK